MTPEELEKLRRNPPPPATPEQYEERIKICEDCEYLRKVELLNRVGLICAACSCFLSAKARSKYARCPKDKWPKLNP